MSGAPWMKFYPSDWLSDTSVRLCSCEAQGLWINMLCLMHQAEPHGSLLVNGVAPTARELAGLANLSEYRAKKCLEELEKRGVFSRDPDGTIFSRRMRKDDAREERDRENGRKGGNPRLKSGVNPPPKGGLKAQTPESRIQTPERPDSPASVRASAREAAGAVGAPASLRSRFDEVERAAIAELGDLAPCDLVVGPLVKFADEVGVEVALPALVDVARASASQIRTWGLLVSRARDRLATADRVAKAEVVSFGERPRHGTHKRSAAQELRRQIEDEIAVRTARGETLCLPSFVGGS